MLPVLLPLGSVLQVAIRVIFKKLCIVWYDFHAQNSPIASYHTLNKIKESNDPQESSVWFIHNLTPPLTWSSANLSITHSAVATHTLDPCCPLTSLNMFYFNSVSLYSECSSLSICIAHSTAAPPMSFPQSGVFWKIVVNGL